MKINILYTFSMSGEVENFRSRIPNRLHGPGVLFVCNCRAYFQKFLVDTTVGLLILSCFVVVVVVVVQSSLNMWQKLMMFTFQKLFWL